MKMLYHCEECGCREFIIDDGFDTDSETVLLVPRVYPPYCPYCGKKDGVKFIREDE